MQKQKIAAIGAVSLAAIVGVGAWAIMPQVTPRAEEEEIQSVQKVVGAMTMDNTLEADVYQITMSTGSLIDEGVVEAQENNVQSPTEGVTDVENRDWTVYDDEYGLNMMTSAQQAYYRRLEAASLDYLTDSTLDAYYVNTYKMYVANGVVYSDLGLSRQDAINVTEWFLYNNPQYYFYQIHFLSTEKSIYIGVYDDMADGDDRASITNQMFSTIDAWVASINDDEVTDYQTILSAHDLVCNEISYVSGTYDQSLYSAVIQRQTVCAGYAEAMNILLNASGIHSTVAVSDCHAWNIVQFADGQYYGIDTTWDDALNGHQLFGCNLQALQKYDSSSKEHTVISAWADWIPSYSANIYAASTYDLTGQEEKPVTTTTTVTTTVPTTTTKQTTTTKVTTKATTSQTTTTTVSEPKLSVPTDFKVSFSGTSATVTWNSVANATSYEVNVTGTTKTVTKTGIKLTGISAGRNMSLKVRAVCEQSGIKYYSDWAEYSFSMPAETTTVTTTVPTTTTKQTTTKATTAKQTTTTKSTTVTTTTKATTTKKTTTTTVKPTTTVTTTVAKSLAAPTVSLTDKTDSSIRVQWNAVSDATKYEISVSSDANFNKILVSKQITAKSVKLTGLSTTSTYYVRVRALNDTVYSDYSTVVVKLGSSVQTIEPPASYEVKQVKKNKIEITWSEVSNAKKYEIEVYKDKAHTKKLVSRTLSKNGITLLGVSEDQVLYVQIRSVMGTGSKAVYSDWLCFETGMQENSSSVKAGVPSNLTVVCGTNSVSARWSEVSNAESYDIEISKSEDFTDICYSGSVDAAFADIMLTDADEGQPVYIRVRGVSSDDKSDWVTASSKMSVSPLGNITGIDALPLSESSAMVNWSKVNRATGYIVETYSDEEHTNLIKTEETSKTSIEVTDLQANTPVYVKVYAVRKAYDTTVYSDSVFVTAKPSEKAETTDSQAVQLDSPEDVKSDILTADSARISWSTSDNATGYEIVIAGDSSYENIKAKGTVKSTSVKLTNIKSDTVYYIKVRAFAKTDDNTYYSDWAYGQLSTKSVQNQTAEISAPELSYRDLSDKSVVIAWSDNNSLDNTEYEVRISKTSDVADYIYQGTIQNKKYATVSGMVSDRHYYAFIRAINKTDSSICSEWVKIDFRTAAFCTENTDSIISRLCVGNFENNASRTYNASVYWNEVPDAVSYQVEVSMSEAFITKLVSVELPGTERHINNVPYNMTYWVRVRAVYADGTYSDWTSASFHWSGLDVSQLMSTTPTYG